MRRFDGDFTKKNSAGQDIFVSPDKIDTIQHRRKSKIIFTEESKATLASVFLADASDFKIEGSNIIYMQ